MTDADAKLREEAERRVAARRSVQAHLLTYVVINAGLFALDWFTDGRIDWAWWPLLGWGIGLFAHIGGVWMTLSANHEADVQREMDRLRGRRR